MRIGKDLLWVVSVVLALILVGIGCGEEESSETPADLDRTDRQEELEQLDETETELVAEEEIEAEKPAIIEGKVFAPSEMLGSVRSIYLFDSYPVFGAQAVATYTPTGDDFDFEQSSVAFKFTALNAGDYWLAVYLDLDNDGKAEPLAGEIGVFSNSISVDPDSPDIAHAEVLFSLWNAVNGKRCGKLSYTVSVPNRYNMVPMRLVVYPAGASFDSATAQTPPWPYLVFDLDRSNPQFADGFTVYSGTSPDLPDGCWQIYAWVDLCEDGPTADDLFVAAGDSCTEIASEGCGENPPEVGNAEFSFAEDELECQVPVDGDEELEPDLEPQEPEFEDEPLDIDEVEEIDTEDLPDQDLDAFEGDEEFELAGPGVITGTVYTSRNYVGRRFLLAVYSSDPLETPSAEPLEVFDLGVLGAGAESFTYEVENLPVGTYFLRVYVDRLDDGVDGSDPFDTFDGGMVEIQEPANPWEQVRVENVDFYVFGCFIGRVLLDEAHAGHTVYIAVYGDDPNAGGATPNLFELGAADTASELGFTIEQVAAGSYWLRAVVDMDHDGFDPQDEYLQWYGSPVIVRFPQAALWRQIEFDFSSSGCSEGTRICSGNRVLVCRDDAWVQVEECETGACINGACQICNVGDYLCAVDVLYVCQGDRWAEVENCFIQRKVCDAESAACVNCNANASECRGNVVFTCGEEGSWEEGEDCSASESVCQFGACTSGEGLDGLWEFTGFLSNGGSCTYPPAGTYLFFVFDLDQNGDSVTMTPADDDIPIVITEGTIENELVHGSGEYTVSLTQEGIDCTITYTSTLEGELFPDGTIGGTIHVDISAQGDGCSLLDYLAEFPYRIPCSVEWHFRARRYHCSGTGVELCENGQDDDCDGAFDEDDCVERCDTPGDRRCVEERLFECSSDGYWSLIEDCGATGQICDWGEGRYECIERCTPQANPPFCDGNVVVSCNTETGRMEHSVDCAEQGLVCQNGECVEFSQYCDTEGDRTCDPAGEKLYECRSGLWTVLEDCSAQGLVCEAEQCRPRTYTVYQLQDDTDPEHPESGTPVRLENILVTSELVLLSASSGLHGVFAQQREGGNFSGILLALSGAGLPELAPGDLVNLEGTYVEFPDWGSPSYTLTEVRVDSIEILEHGLPLPDPVEVSDPSSIATGGALAAALEGLLVEITSPVVVVEDSLGYGEWLVSGNLRVDDLFFDSFTPPAVGTAIRRLRGFVFVSYNNYKLEPRSWDDIVIACTEGETECRGDELWVCSDGEFVFAQTCDGACVDGSCVECRSGETSCEANRLYTCNDQNEWTLVEDCQLAGKLCDETTASCLPCPTGEFYCRGTIRYVCDDSHQWQQVEDCANSGRTCNLGQCVAGDELDGLWFLQGTAAQGTTCSNVNLGEVFDLVLEFDQTGSAFVATSPAEPWLRLEGSVSESGGSLVATNVQEAAQIEEGCTMRLSHTFNASPQEDGSYRGSWTMTIEPVDCPQQPDEFPGPAPCTFAATIVLSRYICYSAGYEVCGNDRDDDCDGVSDEADCEPACSPDTYRCTGSVLEQCDAVGVWHQVEDCEASGKVCNAQAGMCVEACSAEERACRNGELWVCGELGYLEFAEDCTEQGKLCDPGMPSCVEPEGACSTDGLKACLDNAVYVCSNNTFGFDHNCPEGFVCQNGECLNPNACESDADCGEGEVCHSGVMGGTCGAPCSDSEDCVIAFGTAYGYCDPYNPGHCEPREPFSCTGDLGCISVYGWVCHADINGGTCAPPCTKNVFCQQYDAGLVCGDYERCVPGTGCWRDEQCLDTEVCHTSIGDGVCAAPCSTDDDCHALFGGGYACDTATNRCEPFEPEQCCGPWRAPNVGDLVINEVLAMPPYDNGDANNDSYRNANEDEFIEIVNVSANVLNLSGVTVSDASQVRFTFPEGTFLYCGQAAVVFGGGTPNGSFGGSLVFTADGTLGLTDSGDTVFVKATDGATLAELTYGAEASGGYSLTLDPQLDPNGTLVPHTDLSGLKFSPGTLPDGSYFAQKPDCGYHACTTNSDCPEGFVCHPNADENGECGNTCSVDADCSVFGSNLICGEGGLCEPPPEGCTTDADCTAPEVCHPEAAPNGVCAPACVVDENCTTHIGPGLECDPETFRCVHKTTCASDAECYPGEVCHPDWLGGRCGAPCQADDDCSALEQGLTCDEPSGHCVWAEAQSCSTDAECSNGQVCHTLDGNGRCWYQCVEDDDCVLRFGDERLFCNDGRCEVNWHPSCSSNDDCYPGQVCHNDVLGGKCYDPCGDDGDCQSMFGNEYLCDTETGRCILDMSYRCTDNADCAEFNICQTDIGSVCWMPCSSDLDCQRFDIRNYCEVETGLCHRRSAVPCDSDSDCYLYGGLCHTEMEGGVCGGPCSNDADCFNIAHVFGYICNTQTQRCEAACSSDADCPTGEVCHVDVAGGKCAPPCSGHTYCQTEMGPEYYCDIDSGKCAYGPGYHCTDNTGCSDFNRCQPSPASSCPDGGICRPPCSDDEYCHTLFGPGYKCDPSSYVCVVDQNKQCAVDEDCGGCAVCHADFGTCGNPCTDDSDCTVYSRLAHCDPATHACVMWRCTTDDDCVQYYQNPPDGDEETGTEVADDELQFSLVCHTHVEGGICAAPCTTDVDCEILTGSTDYTCVRPDDDTPIGTCEPRQ